jgi:hypothetical protein
MSQLIHEYAVKKAPPLKDFLENLINFLYKLISLFHQVLIYIIQLKTLNDIKET